MKPITEFILFSVTVLVVAGSIALIARVLAEEPFCGSEANVATYQKQGLNTAIACKDGSYQITVKEAQQ